MSRKEESECRNPSEEITSRRVEKLWLILATYPSDDWPKQESLNAVTDLAEKVAYGILSQKDWANVMDAEEVAADVYVNVYKARRNVRRKDTAKSFRAYVWKAAQNQTYSHLRSREGSTDNTKAAKKEIVYASSIDADPHFQLPDPDPAGDPHTLLMVVGRNTQRIPKVSKILHAITKKLPRVQLDTYNFIRNSILEPDDLLIPKDMEAGAPLETADKLEEKVERIAWLVGVLASTEDSKEISEKYALSAGIAVNTAKKRIRDLRSKIKESRLLFPLQKAAFLFLLLITGLHVIFAK